MVDRNRDDDELGLTPLSPQAVLRQDVDRARAKQGQSSAKETPRPSVDIRRIGDVQTSSQEQGDVARGLSSGWRSIKAGAAGATALAGDAIGSDRLRDWGFERYQDIQAENQSQMRPQYEVENIESFGDALDFAQYWVGYAVTQLGPTLGAGAIGSAVAKQIVRRGMRQYVGSKAGQAQVARMVAQNVPQDVAEARVADAARKALDVAVSRAGRRGGIAGTAAPSYGQQLGQTYGQAGEQAISEGGTLDDVNVPRAVAGGLAGGTLEYAGQLAQLGAIGRGPGSELLRGPFDALTGAKGGRLARGAARGLTAGVSEGMTEVGQEFTSAFGAESPAPEPKDLLTPFFAGAVGGGAIGGVGGAASGRAPTAEELRAQRDLERRGTEDIITQESPVTADIVDLPPEIADIPTPSSLDTDSATLVKSRLRSGMTPDEVRDAIRQEPAMLRKDGSLRKDAERFSEQLYEGLNPADPSLTPDRRPSYVPKSMWDRATRSVTGLTEATDIEAALLNVPGATKKEGAELNAHGRKIMQSVVNSRIEEAQATQPEAQRESTQAVDEAVTATANMTESELSDAEIAQGTPDQAAEQTPRSPMEEKARITRAVYTQPPEPPTGRPKMKTPKGGFGTDVRRALYLATQGFTPNFGSEAFRGGSVTPELRQNNVGLVQEALGAVENGSRAIEVLDSINTYTSIRDRALGIIADSGRRGTPTSEQDIDATIAAAADLPPGDPRIDGIEQYNDAASNLNELFGELESLVGRTEMRRIMAAGKRSVAQGDTEFLPETARWTPADPTTSATSPSETSPGILFSVAYEQYLEGSLASPFINPSYMRNANEFTPDNAKVKNKFDAIRYGATKFATRAKAKKSEAENVLNHIAGTSGSLMARRVASITRTALQKNGLLEKGQIRFVTSRDKYRTKGSKNILPRAASVAFADADASHYATITLYKDGQNFGTALHELIHVATVAAIEKSAPGQKGGTKASRAAYRELAAVEKALSKLDLKMVRNQYGEHAANVLEVIRNDFKQGYAKPQAIAELVAYGLTDESIQRVMLATKMDKPSVGMRSESRLRTVGSLWNRFVGVIKRAIGADAVKNTEFERFLFATSELLQEVATNDGILSNPQTRQSLAAIGHVPPADGDPYSAEAAMQSADVQEAAQTAEKLDNAHAFGSRAQAADEAKAQKARDERVTRFNDTARKIADETSLVPENIAKSSAASANIFDTIGRSMMNTFGSAISGRQDFDYQQWAETVWVQSGQRVEDFVSNHDVPGDSAGVNALRKVVGYALGQVKDRFGVAEMLKGIMYNFETNLLKSDGRLRQADSLLADLTENQQYALLEALDTNNDARIEAMLSTEADLDAAKQLAKEVRILFKKGEELGLLSKRDANQSIVDYIRVASRRKLGLKDGAALKRSAATVLGKLPPSKSGTVVKAPTSYVHVYKKDGSFVSPAAVKVGDKFKIARTMTGEEVYVSPDMDYRTFKKENLVPHATEMDTEYTVRSVSRSSGDIVFGRLRTPDELEANNERADILSSILLTTQALNHRISAIEFQDSMLVFNERMQNKSERWILEGMPEDVPESRIIDPKAPGSLSKARIPGVWVKIPDDPGSWGDLSGMYMAGPAYAAMTDMLSPNPLGINRNRRFAAMNRIWKKNMTTWSPVTHANNVGGNFALQYFHDIPSANVKTAFEVVLSGVFPNVHRKLYKRPLPPELQGIAQEVENMGIQLVAQNIQELDPETAEQLGRAVTDWRRDGNNDASRASATTTAVALEHIVGTVAKLDKVASELYSNQDNVFRVAAYMTYIQDQRELGRTIDRTVMEEAGSYARNAFVNYRIDAPLINALRTGAFGYQLPFLAWSYRAIPIVAKTALTKPWKLATITGGLHLINSLAYAYLGEDEEEERNLLPDFMSKNIWGVGAPMSVRMPFGDGDNAIFFHTGNMIPTADIFTMDRSTNVPTVAVPGGPMMVALQAALNYDSFRADEISPDVSQTRMQDTAGFIWNSAAPRVLTSLIDTGNDIVTDPSGPTGHKPSNVIRVARFMGLNLREVNMPEQRLYQGMNVQRLRREFAAERNRISREYFRLGRQPDYDKFLDKYYRLVEEEEKRIREELGVD